MVTNYSQNSRSVALNSFTLTTGLILDGSERYNFTVLAKNSLDVPTYGMEELNLSHA